MFEYIGVLIAGIVFFGLSLVVGSFYWLAAWLIQRSHQRLRIYRNIAALLPPVFAAYMLACAILFSLLIPREFDRIFFGDLFEPLPNGYTLTAMAKMRGFGASVGNTATFRGVSGSVRSVAVDGPLVFGAYINNERYFAFDTRSGTCVDFGTIAGLNRYAGHPVQLIEAFSFRSSDRTQKLIRSVERCIWFGPPLICSVFYFVFLLRLRRRDANGTNLPA